MSRRYQLDRSRPRPHYRCRRRAPIVRLTVTKSFWDALIALFLIWFALALLASLISPVRYIVLW